jgi:hypothetical protein
LHNGQLFYHRCQHLRGGEEPPLLISATLASAYVRWLIGQLDGPQREEALVEWWKFRDA